MRSEATRQRRERPEPIAPLAGCQAGEPARPGQDAWSRRAGAPSREQLAALLDLQRAAGGTLPWSGVVGPAGPVPWEALAARARTAGPTAVSPAGGSSAADSAAGDHHGREVAVTAVFEPQLAPGTRPRAA